MEDGTIILIGATTENPSFSLNSALLSRCKVLTLKKLSPECILNILKRVNLESVSVDDEALDYISNIADGDARAALTNLESVIKWAEQSNIKVTLEEAKVCLSRQHLKYDRKGDEHYHCASALQKSIRGSDSNVSQHSAKKAFKTLIRYFPYVTVIQRITWQHL